MDFLYLKSYCLHSQCHNLESSKPRRQILAKYKPVSMQWILVAYHQAASAEKKGWAPSFNWSWGRGGRKGTVGRWMHETLIYLGKEAPSQYSWCTSSVERLYLLDRNSASHQRTWGSPSDQNFSSLWGRIFTIHWTKPTTTTKKLRTSLCNKYMTA